MSLIHEALQKAEAERRAGELPALLSITATRQRPQRRGGILLPAVVAAAVLAAAAYVNRDLIRPGDDATALAPTTEAEPAPARASRVQTAPAAAKRLEPARSAPARAPAVDVSSAIQSDAIAAKLGLPGVSAMPGLADPEALVEAPEPSQREQMAPRTAPAKATPVQPPPPIVAAAEPVVAVDSADEKESAAQPVATVTETPALPMMFELPLGTRKALPALKVTMFVYSEDRSRRFAIIDGKRVNENGVMGNDLNLIEIQRDGMVLDFRGTRFLLPRLGR
ncbi:MAG: general secretion pathway protein GspB [Xanthomonadales bacterium]|nr:general secretion pathway protein GspB [Xanthomonadales bacterium]